jgi:hypothetical protein
VATKLAIVAGSGALPRQLIVSCEAAGREVFVIAVNDETEPETVQGVAHAWVDIAAIGHAARLLRQAGCEELCLIGPITRPAMARLRPDWEGLKLLPKLVAAARQGDAAVLRVVVEHFESVGFRVVAPEAVVADLAVPAGPLGRYRTDAADEADIQAGIRKIRSVEANMVTQAVVVRGGQVLATEASDGTDAMLARCASDAGEVRAGVLVKWPMPGQELRVDLPTIGPTTVAGARAAGLKGIAVAAGGALVAERERTVRQADEGGLFIVGAEAEVSS